MTPSRWFPRSWWFAACAGILLGVLSLWPTFEEPRVAAQSPADLNREDIEDNRKRLDRYLTSEPEQYARLKYDLRQFLNLPAERQAQLRQLDREVNEEGSSTAFRLLQALGRYVDWLEHLPPGDRQEIERAHREQRIALIRKMREREWIARLPAAQQEQISKATEKDRPALIAAIQKEERERRARWRVAIRYWDKVVVKGLSQPMRLDDLPQDMQGFVRDILIPMLTPEELKRLRDAEGFWPDYPRILVELADKHPVLLPGPRNGPRTFAALPAELQTQLPPAWRKKPPPQKIKDAEGKWPDYLIAIAEYAENNKSKKGEKIVLPPRICPSRPTDFQPNIRNFIDKRLFPKLNLEERSRLMEAEGKWPLYPRLILELSRQKNLEVPGMTLPGPTGWWDSYRTSSLPDLDGPPVLPRTLPTIVSQLWPWLRTSS